jgi:hypothetical protein
VLEFVAYLQIRKDIFLPCNLKDVRKFFSFPEGSFIAVDCRKDCCSGIGSGTRVFSKKLEYTEIVTFTRALTYLITRDDKSTDYKRRRDKKY